jgi:hypothetical protein
MMRTVMFLLAFALITSLTTACRSAQKMMERGDYDAAIEYCVKHLRGKKKKKEELVQGLEVAFERAQQRDMNRFESLMRQNTRESWDKAHNIALDIRDRQDLVEPLVPLRSKSGNIARFDFVNVDKMLVESREKASSMLYAEAERLLNTAEAGDRSAARKAYDLLDELGKKYGKDYRDRQHLMSTALRLGASYTIFTVTNASDQILPARFEDELMSVSTRNLDSRWKKFDQKPDRNTQYQYQAKFVLQTIDISPEFVRENRYWDERTIEDGFEYVLDKRGNVMKDTLGNDVKRPKKVLVRAEILEINQRKTARVDGKLEVYDASGSKLLDRRPLGTEVVFDHLSVTFRGDERALSDKTRCNLGKAPAPFPTNGQMIDLASDRLHPLIADALRSSSAIY